VPYGQGHRLIAHLLTKAEVCVGLCEPVLGTSRARSAPRVAHTGHVQPSPKNQRSGHKRPPGNSTAERPPMRRSGAITCSVFFHRRKPSTGLIHSKSR
jgi:hypothetical protein